MLKYFKVKENKVACWVNPHDFGTQAAKSRFYPWFRRQFQRLVSSIFKVAQGI